jgi:hypothetical protein
VGRAHDDAAQQAYSRGAMEANSKFASPRARAEGTGLVRRLPKSIQLVPAMQDGWRFAHRRVRQQFRMQFGYGTVMEMVPRFAVAPADWACTVT